MQIGDLTVEVRDQHLNRLGQIDPRFLPDAVISPRAGGVGVWSLRLPTVVDGAVYDLCAALREPSAGVIVYVGDEVLCSGTVETTTCEQTAEEPDGMWTITGPTDLYVIDDALAYPDPATADPTAQGKDTDAQAGAAEYLVHSYIHRNIGTAAPASRRAGTVWQQVRTGLDRPGTILDRGPDRVATPAFRPLLELCQELLTSTSLILDVTQEATPTGEVLVVSTREAADLSGLVRLDIDNAQLERITNSLSVPDVTQAIMGGDGEGKDRTIVAATDTPTATLWRRRRERFIAGTSKDVTDLQVQALTAIAEGKDPGSFEATPSADLIEQVSAKTLLGATITLVVGETEIPARVAQVNVAVSGDGVAMGIVLGDPDGTDHDGRVGRALSSLGSRVGALERAGSGGGAGLAGTEITSWDDALDPGAYWAQHSIDGPFGPGGDPEVGMTLYHPAGLVQIVYPTSTVYGPHNVYTRRLNPVLGSWSEWEMIAPAADSVRAGLIKIATLYDVLNGTGYNNAVTAGNLAARVATTTRTGLVALATQAAVDAGTAQDVAVTPATLRRALHLPYSEAAGTTTVTPTANVPTSVTVTLPGKFTVPPIVTATANTGVPGTTSLGVGIGTRTASSFVLWYTRKDTGATSINWHAVQMTEGSANG